MKHSTEIEFSRNIQYYWPGRFPECTPGLPTIDFELMVMTQNCIINYNPEPIPIWTDPILRSRFWLAEVTLASATAGRCPLNRVQRNQKNIFQNPSILNSCMSQSFRTWNFESSINVMLFIIFQFDSTKTPNIVWATCRMDRNIIYNIFQVSTGFEFDEAECKQSRDN